MLCVGFCVCGSALKRLVAALLIPAHIYIMYKGEPGPVMKPWVPPGSALWPSKKGSVLHVYRVNTVQGSLWGHALQRKASDAAIESFCRCTFVELQVFVVVRNISAVVYLP